MPSLLRDETGARRDEPPTCCVVVCVCVCVLCVVCGVFHVTFSDPHRAYTVPWSKSCSAKANKQHKDSTGQRGEKQGMLSRPLNIPCICDEFLRT